MAAIEARRDLNDKLKLEHKLMVKLAVINREIVRETVKKFTSRGLNFDAADIQDEFQVVLEDHYNDVADLFDVQIRNELPDDILSTEAEDTLIEESLAVFFMTRSAEQSQIITDTNQKNIDDSIQFGRDTAEETEGGLSRPEQAMVAGAALSRKLRGRSQGIATTETQTAAETAKSIETDVMIGNTIAVGIVSHVFAGLNKEWVTAGDEKVRSAHVAADSQEVDISKPYTVGGQLLQFPGDMSLGASIGNVANCRCASIRDMAGVFAVRRKRAGTPAVSELPFVDTGLSEELLESIG